MALPNFLTPVAGLANANGSRCDACGAVSLTGYGAFGGGTYKAQMSPDDGVTWIDIVGASWTAAFCNFQINLGFLSAIRIVGSGGTANLVIVRMGAIQKFDT